VRTLDGFIAIGIVGLVIVLTALLFGDLLDGLFDAVDLGSGLFSAPVIGGFLAAFGFGAALARATLGTTLALLVGLAGGLLMGGVAGLLTRSLMRMRTDPTPRTSDLVGRPGVVLTALDEGRFGTIRVAAHGQQLQLSARADEPLPPGTQVVVVEVTSPTAVVVTATGLPPVT
jgi:membrane protein implicated in regulation of membrane protease activity